MARLGRVTKTYKSFVGAFTVFAFLVQGASDDTREVSVMEGDSVTLHTGFTMNSKDRIKWYFHDIRIALITGNQSEICEDDSCKERFSDRLKLDPQTGDLTITNIRTNDSEVYHLTINRDSAKTISVSVRGVSAAERDETKRKSVKEGQSVTLDPGVMKNPNDVMKWYFNETLISEITGNQSKICTDDQCDERFRDRLKVNENEGSLTIMNTRNTDEGDYKLQMIISISNFSITREKRFSVSVTDSGVTARIAVVVVVGVVLLVFVVVVAGVIYSRRRRSEKDVKENSSALLNDVQEGGL